MGIYKSFDLENINNFFEKNKDKMDIWETSIEIDQETLRTIYVIKWYTLGDRDER